MRRTLPSLLVALAMILVALPAFAGNGSSLLQYVPGNARIVVGVDVDKVRGTPLWERALALSNDNGDMLSALPFLGFDPRTTVSSAVFASTEVGNNWDHVVILLETSYPAEELGAALVAEGYEAGTVGTIIYYRKSESTIAFLAPNALAVGAFSLVEPALGVAAGTGSAGASGTVGSQLSAVDTSGAVWAAAQLPSGSQGAEAARLSIDLSAGFAASLTVRMESAERATSTATELTTQLAAISGTPEVQGLGLAALVSSIQATAADADLTLTLGVDAPAWATLVQTLGALAEEEMR